MVRVAGQPAIIEEEDEWPLIVVFLSAGVQEISPF
jgi:hypothetical protein